MPRVVEVDIPLQRVEEISSFFGISRNRVLQSDLPLSICDRDHLRQRDVLPEPGSGSGRIIRKSVWK